MLSVGSPAPCFGSTATCFGSPASCFGSPAICFGSPAPCFGSPSLSLSSLLPVCSLSLLFAEADEEGDLAEVVDVVVDHALHELSQCVGGLGVVLGLETLGQGFA